MAIKCDPRAYAKCTDRDQCGPYCDDVCFVEGSECDKFNQTVINTSLGNEKLANFYFDTWVHENSEHEETPNSIQEKIEAFLESELAGRLVQGVSLAFFVLFVILAVVTIFLGIFVSLLWLVVAMLCVAACGVTGGIAKWSSENL